MPVSTKLLFHGASPKTVFLSGGTPTFKDAYRHENKKTVGGTQKLLLQYCHFPDKFPTIFLGTLGNFCKFKNCYIFIP
jgi:hypothetical protein